MTKMASMDNFKPGAGGLQVNVMGAAARDLGKNFQLGGVAPAGPALSQGPLPNHAQAQIGQSNSPKGAQPVTLVGQQAGPALGQQAPRMPMSPGAIPQAQPQAALGGPSMDGETHTIVVEGMAPDGKKYYAEYDAVFPRGTKVLGVTEKFNG
jgi:hypothetical protein